jgi:RHS repeat-associated protein
MALLAVHHLDPVIGVDVHTVEIPPTPPEPGIPMPHPHVGFVLDLNEYIASAVAVIGSIALTFVPEDIKETVDGIVEKAASLPGVSTALEIMSNPAISAGYGAGRPIFVNGMLRATVGTHTYHVPGLHFPEGVGFAGPDLIDLPSNDAEAFMGSKTVLANHDPMAYMALPALSCWFVGMPPPSHNMGTKTIKLHVHTQREHLSLPTAFMLPIPAGRPVLVGGPPIFNVVETIRGLFKAVHGSDEAHGDGGPDEPGHDGPDEHGDGGPDEPTPPNSKCRTKDAEPVNSITGEVVVLQNDFTVQGRLPLVWNRHYASHNRHDGAVGVGWQTLADTRLKLTRDRGRAGALACFPDHTALFKTLPTSPGWENRVYDTQFGHALYLLADRLVLRTRAGIEYHYPLPPDWPQRQAALAAAASPALTLRLSTLADLNGNAWHFQRDARQTLTRVVESSGGAPTGRAVVCEAGDAPGKLGRLTLTDAANHAYPLARYRQDALGDLIAVEDPLAQPYCFEYRAGHLMVRHTDRNGLSFHYSHQLHPDQLWRVDHAWGDGGLYDYRFVYDLEHLETRLTDSLGHTTILQCNDQKLPVARIDPLGGVSSYRYNEQNRTSAQIDPAGNVTTWDYDEYGNLLCTTLPDGSRIRADYNPDHKPVCITDCEGGQWRQEWDSRGNLTRQTTPGGAATQYEYTNQGDLLHVTDTAQQRTTLDYDALGFLTSLTDPASQRTRFEHDAQGALLRTQRANGDATAYRYDAKQRLIESTLPGARRIQCVYDAEDNLTRYTDEAGRVTRFSYYGQGQLQSRTDPDGSKVEYHYDTEEQLIGVTNQIGKRWQLERDAAGRLVEEIDYWGQSRTYAYDPAGHLTQATDPLGQALAYTCDKLGRIVKRQASEQDAETYQYNKHGQLTQAKNPSSAIERRYNQDGQLTEEKQQQPDAQASIAYAYNPAGQLVEQTRNIETAQTRFTQTQRILYDVLGQPESVQIDEHEPIRFSFDAIGRLTGQRLNQRLAHHYRYNAAGQLAAQGSTLDGQFDGQLDTRIDYDYDDAGNLVQRRDSRLGTDQFRYDLLGQITAHTDPAGQVRRFVYDKAGDRFKTLQQTEQGRTLQHAAGSFWRLARAGQLTHKRDPYGRDTHLRWDAYGRLRHLLNHKQERYEYRYDALGRRICKTSADTPADAPVETTWFLWDGNAMVGELKQQPNPAVNPVGWVEPTAKPNNANPTATKPDNTATSPHRQATFYTYHLGTFVPLAMQTQTPETEGKNIEKNLYFYQTDPNGMPIRLMDGQGTSVWETYYSAFGQSEGLATGRIEQPLRLQGQYCDEESGLHYNRHRYYDAEAGCFISPDPIGLLGGINPYRFAVNVFGWIDPLGLTHDPTTGETKPGPGKAAKGGTALEDVATASGVPGRVQSRINVTNGGMSHIRARHFNTTVNASQFTITESELKNLLRSPTTVSTPVSRTIPSGSGVNYVREVNAGQAIGTDKFNNFQPTPTMTVITDKYGNLVSAFPGMLK